jgi:heme-degrading monooxygenase HmoA
MSTREETVAWVHIQTAAETGWPEYERVVQAAGVDDDPPDGLIVHAAGEHGGNWRSVTVWESEAAYERFRDERLMPAVVQALGQDAVDAGPPPSESFDVKHLVKP